MSVNHAVLIVGYDSDPNLPYYLVKNSWGTQWGEKGYVKIGMSDVEKGICRINTQVMYPNTIKV